MSNNEGNPMGPVPLLKAVTIVKLEPKDKEHNTDWHGAVSAGTENVGFFSSIGNVTFEFDNPDAGLLLIQVINQLFVPKLLAARSKILQVSGLNPRINVK